ncbi:MAG: type II toxin-antitoxin system PemK/MazF family toxin [Acidimicrobiales bacterium]
MRWPRAIGACRPRRPKPRRRWRHCETPSPRSRGDPDRAGRRLVGELPGLGRRPFLVMSRNAAIPVLHSVLAAPVTRTSRGIPTELPLSRAEGLPHDCGASFDNLRVVPKAHLVKRVCRLDTFRVLEACAALRSAVEC